MRLLAFSVPALLTAALLAGCGSDSTAASAGGGGEGSTGTPADGSSGSTSPGVATDTDGSPDTDGVPDTDTDTDATAESSSSSGGPEADPLADEGCEAPEAGEQTPEAIEIADAIEAEIVDLGRDDDIALLNFGIRAGAGAGGIDIFCLSLALHADWFASQETFCVQDTDPDVVLEEASEALASAPTLPSLAELAAVEAAATACLGPFTYIPCAGSAGFLSPTFDPSVLSFSTGEDDGDCTFTSTRVNLDSGSAETLACETESNDTCDTEG